MVDALHFKKSWSFYNISCKQIAETQNAFVCYWQESGCKASHVNIRGNIDKPASDQGQSPNPTPSIFSQMQILQSHPCFCILITNAQLHMSVLVVTGALKPGVTGIFLVLVLEIFETCDESQNIVDK